MTSPSPDDKLTPQQRAYREAAGRKDLIVLQGGRASGKTYAALSMAVEKCVETPNYTIFYWAPAPECNYSFSKWARDCRVARAVGTTKMYDPKMLEFSNGSRIVLGHNPELVRGLHIDWLIVDLLGQLPDIWYHLKCIERVTLILGEDWEVVKMPEVENPYLEPEPQAEVE